MKYAQVNTPIPGPRSKELLKVWISKEADKTGYQAQVGIDRGEGALLFDVDGNTFLDWTSGVLVTNVGHCHPVLVEAVQEASSRMMNIYEYCNAYRVNAASDLVEVAPVHLDRCFFFSTGSEATDSAARIMKRATKNFEIISFYGGFHGRTLSTASLGGLSKSKKRMGPMLPGSIRVPYPYCYRCPFKQNPENCSMICLEFIDDVVQANSSSSLAGLIIEPYQGTAGFIFPPKGYLPKLEAWARDKGLLFTLDEVQSSFGRTGTMWASEHEGLTPDLVATGKGLGGGIPVSALIMRSEVVDAAVGKGELGSTYGGNPVSCAAVSAVLKILRDGEILENVADISNIFHNRLTTLLDTCPRVGDVRGMGLVWGVEVVEDKISKKPAPDLVRKLIDLCAENGLLIGSVGVFGNVIRVAPPLILNEKQANESLDIFEHCVKKL